eukprot:3354534-Pleurochrysis_carterae.AAC.1
MEGSKGGSEFGKFWTGKRSLTARWEDYARARREQSLPVVGSLSLFKKIWKDHSEIRQFSAKSHPKCDECGKLGALLERLGEANDAATIKSRTRLRNAVAAHKAEHRGKRQYFDNAYFRGETYPKRVTCINIDAPTQHQFDIPSQRRQSCDVVKSLDGARKWQSKVTGAMAAGVG